MAVFVNGASTLTHFSGLYRAPLPGEGTLREEKALRKRAVWVEPLFWARPKSVGRGMHRFSGFRRLKKVNIEAVVVAAGQK